MNSLEKVTEVTLYDPESDHCYNVFLNKEDAVRCETDAVFVQSLLFHASCTSTPTTSANIANVNSTNNEEIVQESQNCEQGNIASGSSCNDESQKKKRFRFSEADRIKCIRELHGILAEDDLQNEENVWSRLNDTLMYDNPDRFNTCSLRLLKDHMLEQVLKFRKYDSKEATESGKERLQTPWGNYMRQLMLVWDNYEKLGERAVKVGRPKKKELSQAKEDVEMAKNIRNAALRTIRKRGEIEEGNVEVLEDTLSFPESPGSSTGTPTTSRECTSSATKKRNTNNKEGGVFIYLAEKARLETELQKEELKLKQQQHADNLRLQEETLQFQKSKLEFERERWHVEAQHRQAETARTNLLINIMQTLINKHNQ
ncbi:hypothetical protein FQA39_LY06967 [Lamprigera yunnana]|nr:hypothetical protein FQA39_LY06967 [Lamprigera yunnana]